MTKIEPIIAAKDVDANSRWYQSIFGCRRTRRGNEFAVLVSEDDEVLIHLS